MAKILTPEQRANKRLRDAEYRACKRAAADPQYFVPQKIRLDAKVEDAIQDLLAGKISKNDFGAIAAANPGIEAKPVTDNAFVLAALAGQTVTAPITGMPAVVQKTFRAGGRLLTEDGEHIWASTCPHSTDEVEAKGTMVFFEQVGLGNKDFPAGTTGLVHRFSRCNKTILGQVKLGS